MARVTVGYEVTRRITRIGWFVIDRVFGAKDRRGALGRGMEQSLQRLQTLAEQPAGARPETA